MALTHEAFLKIMKDHEIDLPADGADKKTLMTPEFPHSFAVIESMIFFPIKWDEEELKTLCKIVKSYSKEEIRNVICSELLVQFSIEMFNRENPNGRVGS